MWQTQSSQTSHSVAASSRGRLQCRSRFAVWWADEVSKFSIVFRYQPRYTLFYYLINKVIFI